MVATAPTATARPGRRPRLPSAGLVSAAREADRGTASARSRAASRPERSPGFWAASCTSPSGITSTRQPNIDSTAIWKRPTPNVSAGSRWTSRSRSLPAPAVPRATDPTTRTSPTRCSTSRAQDLGCPPADLIERRRRKRCGLTRHRGGALQARRAQRSLSAPAVRRSCVGWSQMTATMSAGSRRRSARWPMLAEGEPMVLSRYDLHPRGLGYEL